MRRAIEGWIRERLEIRCERSASAPIQDLRRCAFGADFETRLSKRWEWNASSGEGFGRGEDTSGLKD